MNKKTKEKTNKKKCIILAGGTEICPEGFDKSDFESSYIIAADSGCKQLEALKKAGVTLSVDLLLGDMDSFERKRAKELSKGAEFVSYPIEKDYTDTQLALDVAIEKGYDNIEIIGGTGGRADHFLANIALLRYCIDKNVSISILDGKNKIIYLKDGKAEFTRSTKYKYFSVIPDDSDLLGVSIDGARYRLYNKCVERDMPVTVSNEITEEKCSIEIEKGSCFIIFSND